MTFSQWYTPVRQKYFLLCTALFLAFFGGIFSSFASEIHFSADKTQGSMDDVFQVHLSIDGSVDGGKVGIRGLDGNFEIVGQQSSSQIQIINGQTTSVQEQVLSLRPQKSGEISLTALAKENGEIVESDTLTFHIQKSLVQQTKENLLKNSEKPENSGNAPNGEKKSLKNLLTQPSGKGQESNIPSVQQSLKTPEIKEFQKVEHVSAFNAWFWLEFSGILLILGVLFWGVQKILKRQK